jgi:hypothetical protein
MPSIKFATSQSFALDQSSMTVPLFRRRSYGLGAAQCSGNVEKRSKFRARRDGGAGWAMSRNR